MLGNFACVYNYLLSADFFLKNDFQKTFRNTIRVSNSFEQNKAQHVGPDLAPKCLQGFSADDKTEKLRLAGKRDNLNKFISTRSD